MEARNSMVKAFSKLEDAHVKYMIAAGVDVEENPDYTDAKYLDDPT